MTVQKNIARKDAARENLKSHCLCARIEGDIVYLPYGYSVDALRISETAEGYKNAEEHLEKIWQESMFWK